MTDNQTPPESPEKGKSQTAYGESRTAARVSPAAESAVPENLPRRIFFKIVAFSWAHFFVICALFSAWLGRFLFPNVRFEPPTRFRIGRPNDFLPGAVDTRFKKRYGIWIVRTSDRIYALSTVCTHLGCTPNWLPTEEKFKCPCHGSGFDRGGINFEGPAPRPLERYQVALDESGLIVVDKSVVFRQEKSEWDLPESYVAL